LRGEEIRLNTDKESPDKAKPSARRGRKVTNLHEEKMAELPKDTGIERSAVFYFRGDGEPGERGKESAHG